MTTVTYSALVYKGRADIGSYEQTGSFDNEEDARRHLAEQAKTYFYVKLIRTETRELNVEDKGKERINDESR